MIADEDGDQARRRCATWKREEAVDGEDREHVTVLRPRWGARTRVPDRAAAVASLPPPFEARRKRPPRRREVPQRPVRKRAPGRVAIVHQQCKRASPTRRRRPSKRRRHVRASARKAAGNLPSRMECRAGDRQNCGENVHGGNLAGGWRTSSPGYCWERCRDTNATATELGALRVRELHSWSAGYQDFGFGTSARCWRRSRASNGIAPVSPPLANNDNPLPDARTHQACRLSAKVRQSRRAAHVGFSVRVAKTGD